MDQYPNRERDGSAQPRPAARPDFYRFGWVPTFVIVISIIVLLAGAVGVIFSLASYLSPGTSTELASGIAESRADLYGAIAFAGICVAPGLMGSIIGLYLRARQRETASGAV